MSVSGVFLGWTGLFTHPILLTLAVQTHPDTISGKRVTRVTTV